ncbi:MAG: N-acetylmuramoyl-L-alanine amidase [Gemmatirosa sp.]|nr:N-acetylmuramoyl-L-alanine amidase [Gemmatirosa sp.]
MSDPTARPLTKCKNFNALKEARRGVMLHYDDSSSDAGAVAWFTDPECKVSYNYLVLDDGAYVPIVPDGKRAWHAGVCKTSDPARLPYADANSAFVGIAVATNDKTPATPAQIETVVWLTRREFERNGWPLTDGWRIVGHDSEAIWPSDADTPVNLRGKRGRKIDPRGPDATRPILSTATVRARVAGSTA